MNINLYLRIWILTLISFSMFAQSPDLDRGIRLFNEKRYGEALPYLQQAAKSGSAAAQTLLGIMYGYGTGVEADTVIVLNMFNKAMDQGYAPAMDILGDMYSRGAGGMVRNDARAFGLFRRGAESGDPSAKFHLGQFYYWGRGTEQDPEQGFKWCLEAAQEGCSQAYEWVGNIYFDNRSFAEAFKWYDKAGKEGELSRMSRFRLAGMLAEGNGCKFNPVRSEAILDYLVKEEDGQAGPSRDEVSALLASVRLNADLVKTRSRMSEIYRNCKETGTFYDFDQAGNSRDTPSGSGKSCSFPPAAPLRTDNPFYHNDRFSISFWIKDFSPDAEIIRIPGSFPEVLIRNGRLVFIPGPYSDVQGAFSYPLNTLGDGEWHHIALTFGNSVKSLYVDGRRAESYRANTAQISRGTSCIVGGKGKMSLDNLRMYAAKILSAGEAAAIHYMEKERFICDTSVFCLRAPSIISPGKAFRIEFMVKNREGVSFRFFPGKNFEILAGPAVSRSNIVMDGKHDSKVVYTYVIRTPEPGRFLLPAATVISGGKEYRSPFIWVEASAGAEKEAGAEDSTCAEASQPFLDFMAGQLKKSLSMEIDRFKASQKRGFSFIF